MVWLGERVVESLDDFVGDILCIHLDEVVDLVLGVLLEKRRNVAHQNMHGQVVAFVVVGDEVGETDSGAFAPSLEFQTFLLAGFVATRVAFEVEVLELVADVHDFLDFFAFFEFDTSQFNDGWGNARDFNHGGFLLKCAIYPAKSRT